MSLINNLTHFVFLEGLKFLLLLFGLMHFALPVWVDLFVATCLVFFIKMVKQAFFTALFLFVSSLLFSFTWGAKWSDKVWYREHEKWAEGGRYQRDVSDVINMPYGDLYAIGKWSFRGDIDSIKEPRRVTFKTDEFGLRNDRKLSEADFILAGDSFIVANGTDQADMPSVWLEKLSGFRVANVAFPSDPREYERRILDFFDELKPSASIILFYFEGNDFIDKGAEEVQGTAVGPVRFLARTYFKFEFLKDRYLDKVYSKDEVFFRIIRRKSYALTYRLVNLLKEVTGVADTPPHERNVAVVTSFIGAHEMGFLSAYNEVTEKFGREAYIFQDARVLSRIKAVFFIPTKWRTYSQWNGSKPTNDAFDYLKSGYGALNIPVFDLTVVLASEAAELLNRNEYVFWRDDTHWNGAGISAAMAEVAQKVR